MGQRDGRTALAAAWVLGGLLAVGMAAAAWLGGEALLSFRQLERTVTVKGLAEREVPANQVIWPVRFAEAGNDLGGLYATMADHTEKVVDFLREQGFSEEEISPSAPSVTDRQAQDWGDSGSRYRYSASAVITVYTTEVDRVRRAQRSLLELGRQGVALTTEGYQAQAEYLFTDLNALKPAMVEEATRNAREVAEKFAHDSGSRLGRIRTASQGQFSIADRDSNTPHVKRVRVVSTIEYYLD